MKETVGRVTLALRQQAVFGGRGSLEFFPVPGLIHRGGKIEVPKPMQMGRDRNFPKSQSRGGSSGLEFFQVPEPRRNLRILPSPRNTKKYDGYMKKI